MNGQTDAEARAPAAGTRTGQRPPGQAGRGGAVRPGTARPGTRPGTGPRPARGARTGTGLRPAARPGVRPRPGSRTAGRPAAAPDRPRTGLGSSRTPFVLLVVGLLGGGLLCLLLINTILDGGAIQITALQQQNASLIQRQQALEEKITSEKSLATIEQEALRLGMVRPGLMTFLNLRTGHIDREPVTEPGFPAVPGYTP